MKTFIKMTIIDFKRTLLHNPAGIFASLLMPIGFYLLFTKVMNQNMPLKELASFQKQYLVSMIIYSMVVSMFFSLPSLLAMDEQVGIPTWLQITALPKVIYYAAKFLNLLLQNSFSIIVVSLLAVFANHIEFTPAEFLLTFFWLLLASLPLALVGMMISLCSNENTRDLIANLFTFPLVIISGLWWPIDSMPEILQQIVHWSPVYALNQGGQALADSKNFSLVWPLIIFVSFWLLLVAAVCLNKLKNRFSITMFN